MEKTTEHEMETGRIQGYIRVVMFGVWIVGSYMGIYGLYRVYRVL